MNNLTTKVEVDGGRDLSIFVLGPNLVEAGVTFDDVVEFEDDEEVSFGRFDDAYVSTVVLFDGRIAAEPRDVGLRRASELALEDQPVAVVLLTQLRFAHEARREVLAAHRPHLDLVQGTIEFSSCLQMEIE